MFALDDLGSGFGSFNQLEHLRFTSFIGTGSRCPRTVLDQTVRHRT